MARADRGRGHAVTVHQRGQKPAVYESWQGDVLRPGREPGQALIPVPKEGDVQPVPVIFAAPLAMAQLLAITVLHRKDGHGFLLTVKRTQPMPPRPRPRGPGVASAGWLMPALRPRDMPPPVFIPALLLLLPRQPFYDGCVLFLAHNRSFLLGQHPVHGHCPGGLVLDTVGSLDPGQVVTGRAGLLHLFAAAAAGALDAVDPAAVVGDGRGGGAGGVRPGPHPHPLPPAKPGDETSPAPRPTRFYGVIELDPLRAKLQFAEIVDEVVAQFTALPGAKVRIQVDINADAAEGFSEGTVRAAKENANTLKFRDVDFD
mgnify:CR=1 FL=1